MLRLFLFLCLGLTFGHSASAQSLSNISDPSHVKYKRFMGDAVEARNWQFAMSFPACSSCEPYVVFCSKPINGLGDLRGRSIRAYNEAAGFFTDASGKVAQHLAASELNIAMELGIIDCAGFGGKPRLETELTDDKPDTKLLSPERIRLALQATKSTQTDAVLGFQEGRRAQLIEDAGRGDAAAAEALARAYYDAKWKTKSDAERAAAGVMAYFMFQLMTAAELQDMLGDRLTVIDKTVFGPILDGNCKGIIPECRGLQVELKRDGLYSGAIDGIIGRKTSAALKSVIGRFANLSPPPASTPKAVAQTATTTPAAQTKPAAGTTGPGASGLAELPNTLDDF